MKRPQPLSLFDDAAAPMPTPIQRDEPLEPEPAPPASVLATFAECQQAIRDLYLMSLRSKGDQAFFEFLDFARRFGHMSVFNAMMVQVQRRGCALAATRKQWASIGRRPTPDAVPLIILRPFGPLNFAYDYDDTEGKPLPVEHANPFAAKGGVKARTVEQLISSAKANGVRVEKTDRYGGLLAGTAAAILELPSEEPGGGLRWRVRINSRHTPPVQFATLTHELGHVYCGHLGGHPAGRWPARRDLDYAQQEIEAESVAWLVCKRRGVEPNSPDYLRSLAQRVPLETVDMYAIFSAANRVEAE